MIDNNNKEFQPIKMGDLVEQTMKYHSDFLKTDPSKVNARAQAFYEIPMDEKIGNKKPAIQVHYSPPLNDRESSRLVFYFLDDCREFHIGQKELDEINKIGWVKYCKQNEDSSNALMIPNPEAYFKVFDIDIGKIPDPNVSIDDIKQIYPSDIIVVPFNRNFRSREFSYDGPRATDENQRKRVFEYFQNDMKGFEGIKVDRFIKLRIAATNKKLSPQFGEWTYQYVKEEAECPEKEHEIKTFKMSDFEWLEKYMEYQGIPIPEK